MKKFFAVSTLFLALGEITAVAEPHPQVAYGQPQGWHGVMSVDDQAQFDRYYASWVDATRRNDRDAISDNARKMQDLMTRYNIPTSVSFDQIVSASPYPQAAAVPYPAGSWQARLSADDQKEFDKQYKKWVDATRKADQDDISSSARKMQDVMARYSIPSTVPFAEIASGGAAVAVPAYPNTAYSFTAAQRLSGDDQKEFDKSYKKWVEARRKHHLVDADEDARKMQDIMARYNIPANVQFDQIASPGAVNH